ncbi:hypothetical protein DIPPA_29042 [Diplonema papillatum]|nr:hypothetical protein DIPPA_29042 [Diplonema papillatum]
MDASSELQWRSCLCGGCCRVAAERSEGLLGHQRRAPLAQRQQRPHDGVELDEDALHQRLDRRDARADLLEDLPQLRGPGLRVPRRVCGASLAVAAPRPAARTASFRTRAPPAPSAARPAAARASPPRTGRS